ncbi:MAG: hypothetical protein ABI442_13650 [Gemmatimonadaceae bacterium]
MLTPEQRSRLVPNIDVEALQRFLESASTNPEERNFLLQLFTQQPGQNTSFQPIGPPGADPSIIALLGEVWAPTWEAWGADAIEHSDSRLPGREIARARLAAKKFLAAKNEEQVP